MQSRFHPVLLLQRLVVLLNATPLKALLAFLYAQGLAHVLARLRRIDAVAAVYGCGSQFDGQPLYGYSDIDLIVFVDARYTRQDRVHDDIAKAYAKARRFFPFIGGWDEKEENLIFLHEIQRGYSLPVSFRLRWKTGRLKHLQGRSLDLAVAPTPFAHEWLVELDTVLRVALLKGKANTSKALHWKRMFTKLLRIAEGLGQTALADDLRRDPALAYVHSADDTRLFFRGVNSVQAFSRLLDFTRRLCAAVQSQFPQTPIALTERHALTALPTDEPVRRLRLFLDRAGLNRVKIHAARPPVCGLLPQLFYFPVDRTLVWTDLTERPLRSLYLLKDAFLTHGKTGESFIVRLEGIFFIMTRHFEHVDVVALNPVLYANLYAALEGKSGFHWPTPLLSAYQAEARDWFRALQRSYQAHENTIEKLPYPCYYLDDDSFFIRDALQILRAYFAATRLQFDLLTLDNLFEELRRLTPEANEFLQELRAYDDFVSGRSARRPRANQIYRCLHEYMAQVLKGARSVNLSPPVGRLGISVGMITRNRARDLAEALQTLVAQSRPPDEVVILDNGSTDDTAQVIAQFTDRLPIQRLYLEEPSIPRARNLVLEKATHEIVSFTDDDCLCDPNWLASIERAFLRAKNVGMVGGWVRHARAPQPSTVDTYYSTFHHNTT